MAGVRGSLGIEVTDCMLPPPSNLTKVTNVGDKVAKIKLDEVSFAKELGLSTREIAHLQKLGKLEQRVANTFEKVVSNPISKVFRPSNKPVVFNFTETTTKYLQNPNRMVPMHILERVIESPIVVLKDPRGASGALMYYSQMWRNKRLYNIEVLYDKRTNQILHFKYDPGPLGPLKEIPR